MHWIVAFGVTRGCLLIRGIPRFHRSLELVHQTWTLFSASSFDHNFRPNNNQTFIVYEKSTLVLYTKGLCGFFLVLGFALEEKLCGAKCCKFNDQREYMLIAHQKFRSRMLGYYIRSCHVITSNIHEKWGLIYLHTMRTLPMSCHVEPHM